jgi:D-arabinose 1-dehydrogenase-like Zn-dependent alcohol dehydrogenase
METSVTGSFLGSRLMMKEMLSYAQAKGIAPEIELMPMLQANEAIQRMRENKARYRIVLVNEPASG